MSPGNGASEALRLGVVVSPPPANASFVAVAGLSDPSAVSIQVAGGVLAGMYMTLTSGVLSGGCAGNYAAPAGDVVLTDGADRAAATWGTSFPPPPPPPIVTIDVANVTHTINPKFSGCHLDPGYTQQPRGWTANLLYGSDFSQGTMHVPSWGLVADAGVAPQMGSGGLPIPPFNGKPSQPLLFSNAGASGWGGLRNRGMGGEGLALVAGGVYEGFVFVAGAAGLPMRVQLVDFTSNATLAESALSVPAAPAGTMVRVNFTLPAASAGTACVPIAAGSDPSIDCAKTPNADHVCVRCGGELRVQFDVATSGGTTPPYAALVYLGYAWLQPGAWGRVGDLPVLKSAGDAVSAMGINVLRQGGTVSQSFAWKDWRGDPWARPAMGHVWGDSLVDPWGPFEMMALADYMGFEMILTLAYDLNKAEDWADLVEYVWGGAATTWGAQRIADGHAEPYNISIFELGNEQQNPDFVAQVSAMEARATSLGRPGQLRWMYPTNDGVSAATASALVAAGIAPNRVMPDIHIGAGGALAVAQADFAANPAFGQSAINCETNAGTHDMGRALGEAADLIAWFSALPPFAD